MTYTMTSNPDDTLQQLSDAGVSVWLDDISRDRLRTGNLEALIRDMHVVGVTSNPTIFAHALSSGSAYDGQIADLAVRGVSVEEASRAITTYDIRWACDAFQPVFEATGGQDGRVSLEVGAQESVVLVGRIPTISTVSPTLTSPRSILPVTTVPRPLIPKTSSMGIRNG